MVPEDIISIKGQQVEIASKEVTAPVNSSEFLPQELKKQWIDLKQERDVMFLDSWEVKETEKENKVHYFITVQWNPDTTLNPFLMKPLVGTE